MVEAELVTPEEAEQLDIENSDEMRAFALQVMGASLDPIREACTEFVDLLWQDNGGFIGHPADDVPDCEYTFYALLALGILR